MSHRIVSTHTGYHITINKTLSNGNNFFITGTIVIKMLASVIYMIFNKTHVWIV